MIGPRCLFLNETNKIKLLKRADINRLKRSLHEEEAERGKVVVEKNVFVTMECIFRFRNAGSGRLHDA